MKTLRLALLLLAALALGSCDSHLDEAPAPALSFTPIPQGESLFGSLGKSAQEAAYGCYVSSPNIGAPDSERYRYEAFFLHFPDHVIAAAEGQKKIVKVRIGSSALYADTERAVPAVVRVARCLIPDTDEAERLLVEQAMRFQPAEGAAWQGEPMETAAGAGSSGKGAACSILQVEITECTETEDPPLIAKNLAEECTTRTETHWFCDGGGGGNPGGGDGGGYWGDDGSGGPGGGGGTAGPGSDTCDATQVMPPTDQEGLCGGDQAPEGVDPAVWDIFNQKEKELCREDIIQCAQVAHTILDAKVVQKFLQDTNWENDGHNIDGGPNNAFTHAFWSAWMASKFGVEVSERWGNAHEWPNVEGDPSASDASKMDFYNNRIGRGIGDGFSGSMADLIDAIERAYYNKLLYCIKSNPHCFVR